MATIVCFTNGDGETDLDPPDHEVLITGSTVHLDGAGDTTVQINYEEIDR